MRARAPCVLLLLATPVRRADAHGCMCACDARPPHQAPPGEYGITWRRALACARRRALQVTLAQAKPSSHKITAAKLAQLGGAWAGQEPPSEDELYEWLASPWRLLANQHDVARRHENVMDELGADGYVMFHELAPGTDLTVSNRFACQVWEMKTNAIGAASEQWVEPAWAVLEAASFQFLKASMQMVDQPWLARKRASKGAKLHALTEAGGSKLAAAALVAILAFSFSP